MSSLSLYRTGNYPDYPLYTIDTTPYAETSPATRTQRHVAVTRASGEDSPLPYLLPINGLCLAGRISLNFVHAIAPPVFGVHCALC